MKRLFISLYLLLSLSFLGIGWTLDSFWQHKTDENIVEKAPLIALAQVLSQLPESDRASYLNNITHFSDFPLSLMNIEQLALTNKHHLKSDSLIALSPKPHSELYFIAVGNQALMIGPLKLNHSTKLNSLFNLFFYLSIVLISFLCVWPLLKDLKTLNTAAKQLNMAQWNTRVTASKNSQIYDLSNIFNKMANHISHLIDNQTHLLNAVSHEIRTPLSRLKFALALILQYAKPHIPNQKQLVENTNQDIDEIEALLEELLSYTSLDPQFQQPKLEPVEINQLVEKTIKRLQTHQKKIITFIPLEVQTQVTINAILIDRALQNLITNAQKFGDQSVIVEINKDSKAVEISVTDDGEGIAISEQEKIFEPFYRSQQQKQYGPRGYGLGLAIVKRIMNKHQGSATLESSQGKTTFSLHLPLDP
ncbi:ATP-binding protein [uncultured Shewanella sp.]|uniref:sensor histidine kinase n=1 Tax=uncultured Shewanella sp. TaxID=173975 RepID=UPI00260A522D|nr:ATP-binding protein [uncultured Shewanella sp.]